MYLLRLLLFLAKLFAVRSDIDLDLLETSKNSFQYLEEQNYTYENHTVTTEDGYNLLLVRIPYDRVQSSSSDRPPILFVHAFIASFSDYLVTGPGISLSFKALEQGYDVFFLNTRGNRWSRSHTTLDPDLNSDAYWNFSWHEVGIYDLPATIDYITNITGYSKISYVGHSQGSTEFLAMASTRPEYNEKITIAILLAPMAYLGNAQCPILLLLKNGVDFVKEVTELIELNELLPYIRIISETIKVSCSPNSPLVSVCVELFNGIIGPSTQTNKSVISAYFTNFPAGVSMKQFLHYLQNANSGEFRLYDFGDEGNTAEYGQTTPPDYNLSAVTSPVALYYGTKDYLVSLFDVTKLALKLPKVVQNVAISSVTTNHFDVLFGTLAEKLVSQPALNILNKYNDL